jgi:division protein CdvB (Snf7/Vps24/ESCRT-III family)
MIDEDIAKLQVTMDDILAMQVLQSVDELQRVAPHFELG